MFGYKDFLIALGYKGEDLKSYFLNYGSINSDFTINLASGKTKFIKNHSEDWNVTLINTGLNTLTGGRLKKLREYIGNETFMLTYGDGVSDINIEKLLNFHKSHKKMITLSAVRPTARFGEISIDDDKVVEFEEKPQMHDGWINGGFFVIEPGFFLPMKVMKMDKA